MNITLPIIAEELLRSYTKVFVSRCTCSALNCVKLYHPNHACKPGELYICNTGDISAQMSPELSYLFIGHTSDRLTEDLSYILIEDDIPIYKVFEDISAIFNWLNDWERRILTSIITDCSVQALVDISLEMFNNEINVYNDLNALIAICDDIDKKQPMRWKEISGLLYMDTNSIQEVLDKEVFEHIMSLHRSKLFFSSKIGHRFITCNAWNGEHRLANITIPESVETLRSIHLILLDELCKYVGQVLQRNAAYIQQTNADSVSFFVDVIQQTVFSDEEYDHHLSLLDWKPDDTFIVTVLVAKSYSSESNNLLISYLPSFSNLVLSSKVFIYNHALVILSNITGSSESSKMNFNRLKEVLSAPNCPLCGGFSKQFNNFKHLSDYYSQALYAAFYSACQSKPTAFSAYDKQITNHLIHVFAKEHRLLSSLHPAVEILIQNQNNCSFDLMETLFCWLLNGKKLNICANKLFIHNNTLQYRIRKILELLNGVDLDNDETVLNILISIKMYYSAVSKAQ